MKRALVWAVVWAQVGALLVGCEPMPKGGNHRATQGPTVQTELVQFLVASSRATQVTARFGDGTTVVTEKRGLSPRLSLPAGPMSLSLLEDSTSVCETGLLLVPEGHTLLVSFLRPDATAPCPQQKLTAFSLAGPKANLARVSLAHVSPEAPILALLDEAGRPLVPGVLPMARSAYYTAHVGRGATLRLGTPPEKTALFEWTLQEDWSAGQATTLLAVGGLDPLAQKADAFGLLSLDETSGTAREIPLVVFAGAPGGRVLFFHAGPELGAVEVWADSRPAFARLGPLQGSPLSGFVAGPHALSIEEGGQPVWRGGMQLWPGRDWVLVLYGAAQAPKLAALPKLERLPQTVWRVVNVALDSVDVLEGDTVLFAAVQYGQATAPEVIGSLRPKTLRLRDRKAANSWEVQIPPSVVAAAMDQAVTLVISGSLEKPTSVGACLVVESRAGATAAPPVFVLPISPTS